MWFGLPFQRLYKKYIGLGRRIKSNTQFLLLGHTELKGRERKSFGINIWVTAWGFKLVIIDQKYTPTPTGSRNLGTRDFQQVFSLPPRTSLTFFGEKLTGAVSGCLPARVCYICTAHPYLMALNVLTQHLKFFFKGQKNWCVVRKQALIAVENNPLSKKKRLICERSCLTLKNEERGSRILTVLNSREQGERVTVRYPGGVAPRPCHRSSWSKDHHLLHLSRSIWLNDRKKENRET